jgi:membrane protein
MSSWKERLAVRVDRLRERWSVVDHAITTAQHYTSVNGNAQAGAVTFFGFLSFFPILALGFFFVGLLSGVSPELRGQVRSEIDTLLPGVIGPEAGQIRMSTFEDYAGAVGLVGFVGILYSGLGWLSGMRAALEVMFVLPARAQPNFVVGKLRDLATLALIGVTLVVSVALSALVSGFSERIIEWLGFDPDSALPAALLWLVAHGLAVIASTVLLLTMFKLLAQPHIPRGSLVRGALLGALGFEALKMLAGVLIAQTKGQPSFQAFGVTLILVVWINYFSRLVMLAASWAYTAPDAVEQRRLDSMMAPGAALSQGDDETVAGEPPVSTADGVARPEGAHRREERSGRGAMASAAAVLALAGAAVVAWGRRGKIGA